MTVVLRTKLRPKAPETWTGICRALGWSAKISSLTWSVLLDSDDKYTKGLAGSFLYADIRLALMSKDSLTHFVKSQASPRALCRVLELSVKKGVISRGQASDLQSRLLTWVDKDGAWRRES